MNQTWENVKKTSFGLDFDLSGQIRAAKKIFFSKIWLGHSLDILVSYHHAQYQKKTKDPILRKHIDKWTDRRTDGHTDGQTQWQE